MQENARLIQKVAARVSQPKQENADDLIRALKKLPFWCGHQTIHIEKPDTYQDEFCCLTHVVGLPRHSATNEPMPLTPYQVEFFEIISRAKQPRKGQTKLEAMHDAHKFHVNKGRQMGFTEIVLRIIQYYCFHDYQGSQVGIIAATNGSLAKKDLRRFARLFKSIPSVVKQWVKNSVMYLKTNVRIEAFAASEEAITGDTKYKCIFMDEAAKWRVLDDLPIFNSIIPIVETNGSDLFLVSTPKGRIKMFYEIHKEHEDYIMIKFDIWDTEGNLYTRVFIEKLLQTKKEDPNQEYLGLFTEGRNAALGDVTDDDRDSNSYEWGVEPEDDHYTEPDDHDDQDDNIEWGAPP